MLCRVVVLPAPLAPIRVTISLLHMEADAVQSLDIAVGDGEIFDLEQHQSVSSPR